MGESIKHMELVEIAKKHIETLVPSDYIHFIRIDTPNDFYKPESVYEGFRPDVLYSYNDLLIIGEAKTFKDFETEHSRMQFDSYLKYCEAFCGISYLIISIPWQLQKTAKNYFIKLKKDNDFKTVIFIINDFNNMVERI